MHPPGPEPRSPSKACGPPAWSVLVAGVSAGLAVVAFLVMPWPGDLVVLLLLAAWARILSAASGPDGCKRPSRVLLLVGVSALGLGGLAIAALAVLLP